MFRDVVGLHGSLIIPFKLVRIGIGIGYPILEVLKSLGVAPKEVDSANRAVTIALVVAAVCGERTIVLKQFAIVFLEELQAQQLIFSEEGIVEDVVLCLLPRQICAIFGDIFARLLVE